MATENLFTKCTPYLHMAIDQVGTLTACNGVIPTPSEIDSLFKRGSDWYVLGATFALQMELKACQVRQTPFVEFLNSNRVVMDKKINKENLQMGLDRIRPYILAKRRNPINNNYWYVSQGTAGSNNTWMMTFESPTGIPAHKNWFNTGEYVFITGVDNTGNNIRVAMKVVSSTVVNEQKLSVVMQPMTSGSFLPDARKALPTVGIAVRGTNNVSDFESFCVQAPGILSDTMDEFWIQTSRTALAVDELYEEWRNLLLAHNQLFRDWYNLPTTEYNRQVGEDWARRSAYALMYNVPLPNQTIATLDQLEDIEAIDPVNGNRCVGKRANAIGFYEQHVQCGRVVDLQGGRLSLPSLFTELYKISRIRSDTGSNADTQIDILMPSSYAVQFQGALLSYFEARSKNLLNLNLELSSKLEQNALGFRWRKFQLDFPEVTINVITDKFFDDLLDVCKKAAIKFNKPSLANIGRQIWILDWSRNYKGVLASNRVVNETGDLKILAASDPTYRCVMRVPTTRTTLTSETWTAISECPAGDLIIENFDNQEPTLSDAGEYTD